MTEVAEKAGRFLKVRHDPGTDILIIEDRDGGQFSFTLEEWGQLQIAVRKALVSLANFCPQCGNPYRCRSCGPTHAIVAQERNRFWNQPR